MTLAALRAAYPAMFHKQDWFTDEDFLHVEADPAAVMPTRFTPSRGWGESWYSAATLAALYVREPTNPIWRQYLWTSDTDRHGQPVYVGDNGRGLEIHRHLTLTSRWGHAA